jgi:hypothetical protein
VAQLYPQALGSLFVHFYDSPGYGGLTDSLEVEVTLRLAVGQSVSLGVEPHLGLMTRSLLLFDSYGLVFVGRPLTRGRVCLLYMLLVFAGAVFLGSESLGSRDHPKWVEVEVEVTLRLTVYRQSVCLGVEPLETHDQIFFPQLNPCDISPYVTSSLTRKWVCLLLICLAFRQVYISHI